MNLLATGSLSAGSLITKIDKGAFRGLFLWWTGTAASTYTMTSAECGSIELLRRGETIMRLTAAQLQAINNLKYGIVDTSSTVSSTFSFTAYLPFHMAGDLQNVLSVTPSDQLTLQVTYGSNMSTYLSSGTLYVYGVEGLGVQKYLHKLRNWDIAIVSGDVVQTVPAMNVFALYMENDSNLSKVTVHCDGAKRFEMLKTALISATLLFNQMESYSSSTPYLDVNLNPTGALDESLSDDVKVIVTGSGSSTESVVIGSLEFSKSDTLTSAANRKIEASRRTANVAKSNPDAAAIA